MPSDARQIIARAASGDDREGLEIADDILADLAAHGLRIVGAAGSWPATPPSRTPPPPTQEELPTDA